MYIWNNMLDHLWGLCDCPVMRLSSIQLAIIWVKYDLVRSHVLKISTHIVNVYTFSHMSVKTWFLYSLFILQLSVVTYNNIKFFKYFISCKNIKKKINRLFLLLFILLWYFLMYWNIFILKYICILNDDKHLIEIN